jgi:hypothetical protein
LPNAERANVELRRIREYLLNTAHPAGAPKARFFIAHGFASHDVALLHASLVLHGQTNAVVRRVDTAWGTRCTVACHCQTPDGRNPCIRTVWQIEQGVPRLLTVLPRP